MIIKRTSGFRFLVAIGAVAALSAGAPVRGAEGSGFQCERTISAQVVALDQAFYNNRLGAFQAGGMVFALKRDVINNSTNISCARSDGACAAGNVRLRDGKRARPIALRMNVGDCMRVQFTNLLLDHPKSAVDGGAPYPEPNPGELPQAIQPATRLAGLHVAGMQLIEAQSEASPPGLPRQPIDAGGHWVGSNDAFNPGDSGVVSGLVAPGASILGLIRFTMVSRSATPFFAGEEHHVEGTHELSKTRSKVSKTGYLAHGLDSARSTLVPTARQHLSEYSAPLIKYFDDINSMKQVKPRCDT